MLIKFKEKLKDTVYSFQKFNKDVQVAAVYSRLFVAKLSSLLKSETVEEVPKGSILHCIDRAFKTIDLSVENVEALLQSFVRNIEPKIFGHRNGRFLCSVFTNLCKFHSSEFMDTLFEDASR